MSNILLKPSLWLSRNSSCPFKPIYVILARNLPYKHAL